jgi:hypothetical protein
VAVDDRAGEAVGQIDETGPILGKH